MRSRRHRLAADPPELNLVPLLDMVSLLIQLMLINAQFGSYAELPSTAATAVSGHPQAGVLALQVVVATDGYHASWSEGEQRSVVDLPCAAVPCEGVGAYDHAGLRKLAREIKDRFPAERQVVIAPRSGVNFEVLVKTMDLLRDGEPGVVGAPPLFPDAVFAGGRK